MLWHVFRVVLTHLLTKAGISDSQKYEAQVYYNRQYRRPVPPAGPLRRLAEMPKKKAAGPAFKADVEVLGFVLVLALVLSWLYLFLYVWIVQRFEGIAGALRSFWK